MAPDEVPEYDVEEREASDVAYFSDEDGLPFGAFNRLLEAAAIHAAESARADPTALPWIPRGPRNLGGRISALAQHPAVPRIIFAGSAFGGLWKTENGGDTWRPLTGFLQSDSDPTVADKELALPIGAIGICARTPNTIYVGTGEVRSRGSTHEGTGLYRSDDGGQTFTQIDPITGGASGARGYNAIHVDPWDPNRFWTASKQGLWFHDPTQPVGARFMQIVLTGVGYPAAGAQNVTDLVIDFGPISGTNPPAKFTLYAGLEVPGGQSLISRLEFDRSAGNLAHIPTNAGPACTDLPAAATVGITPAPAVGAAQTIDGRVRLAMCANARNNICAIFGTTLTPAGGSAQNVGTRVVTSSDQGNNWAATSDRLAETLQFPWYAFCLAMHPDDPNIIVTGSADLYRTTNGGTSWNKILDRTQFREGDRAQHADQHALFFDLRDPRRIWVGNDGGISETPDLGATWRKRSHGIIAGQFYDLAIHPVFPCVMGGGLQDNGSWVSFGGTSWFQCGIADGGGLGFTTADATSIATSHQGDVWSAVARLGMQSSLRPPELGLLLAGGYDLGVHLPDQPTGLAADGSTTYPFAVFNLQVMNAPAPGPNKSKVFGRKLEGHPNLPDTFLFGWTGEVYGVGVGVGGGTISASPPTLIQAALGLAARIPAADAIRALAFDPSQNATWWVGTGAGNLFFTTDSGTNWVDVTPVLGAGANEITGIGIHPGNSNIVVVTTGARTNNVWLSANALARTGAAPLENGSSNWRVISHASGTPAAPSPANRDLPRSPATRAVIDPTSSAVSDVDDHQTVYVGTLAGVYVCRNATVDPTVAPLWRTMNANMPLVLVRDLDIVTVQASDGTPQHRLLRAATFGRGVYECALTGSQTALLYIRSSAVEDGYSYFNAQAMTTDPRLNVPGAGPPALDPTRAIDIRIDAAPYSYFGEDVDGVEFDEDFRSDTLVLGETNFVYVQVHTRGSAELAPNVAAPPPGTANPVEVHLYFADATGAPATAPALDAGFWTSFPAEPAAGAVWQKAGVATVTELHAGQPRVARLEWGPPTTLGANVALLAVANHPADPVSAQAAVLPLDIHPGTAPVTLIPSTHRAALQITPTRRVAPDVYVRDGIGDTGEPGAVAWGGRSADIVVSAANEADPDQAFGGLTDARDADRIQAQATNFVYVRVFNRSAAAQTIGVDLYFVPMAAVADPTAWVQIGNRIEVADVPGHAHRFAGPFEWVGTAADPIPDPAPGSEIKAHILVAIVGSDEDPVPDHTTIGSLAAFWDFFLSADQANNAALRAIRYVP